MKTQMWQALGGVSAASDWRHSHLAGQEVARRGHDTRHDATFKAGTAEQLEAPGQPCKLVHRHSPALHDEA